MPFLPRLAVRSRSVCALLLLLFVGCQRVNYPEATVTSPLGRSTPCAHCKKTIDSVAEANLVTVDGVQFYVCDEKCAAGIRDWMREQSER